MQTFRLVLRRWFLLVGLRCPGFYGFIEGCILNSVITEVTVVGVQTVHLPCRRPVPMGRFFIYLRSFSSGNVCILPLV